jgi:hypothetical protein
MAITKNSLNEYTHWQPEMTKIINEKPVRFRDVCVHEIRMGDVDDPDLWVASPIYEWQQTEPGKFIMEHAVEQPYWISQMEPGSYSYVYKIMARLSEQNETFWRLLCSNK